MNEAASQGESVSLREVAAAFTRIALASFGGGLSAWSRTVVVVDKKWLTEDEFLSALTMCRILPGANQVNLAVFVGTRLRGIAGAGAAVFGLCCLPVVFLLAMAFVYFRFKEVPAIAGLLHGASAAAVALTLTMVVETGRRCLRSAAPVALCAAAFVLNGVLRWPLVGTLAVVAPLCLLWAWPRGRPA